MQENKAIITKRLMDGLEPKDKDYFVWDDTVTGFCVRVSPTGKKTFFVQYRTLTHQQRRTKLGQYGQITVDQARKNAKDLLADVTKGKDPGAERHEARKEIKFKDFSLTYMKDAAGRNKPLTFTENQRRLDRYILPALGEMRLSGIGRSHIATLIQKIHAGDTPAQKELERRKAEARQAKAEGKKQRIPRGQAKQPDYTVPANHALALLKVMFHTAEKWGYIPDNSNPCRHIAKYPVKSRERFLQTDELARLGQALVEAESENWNPWGIGAIRLLLFLGARKQEILTLKWEYIDAAAGTIRLPDSKTGAKTLYLNAPAVEVIKRLAALRHVDSPWVIQGIRPSQPLAGLQGLWLRLVTARGKGTPAAT